MNPYCSYQCKNDASKTSQKPPKASKKPKTVLRSPVTNKAYPKRSKLIEALVNETKRKIKIRDKNTCQKCGKVVEGRNLQGSHVIPMSKCRNNRLAFDELNIKVLCSYCHQYFWHSNPIESGKWFEEKFPDRAKYLREHPQLGLKTFELQELYDELKSR